MSNVIEINGLTKRYGKSRGVEDVSFSVEEGIIYGFLGPNGAGKSTTIRSMLGMLQYEKGTIHLFRKDTKRDLESILAEVGYMPSEAMFYPTMRVSEVIRLAADIRKKDCREEAKKLCDRLQVDTRKRIDELSLGNRKKVSIVCAMQHRPKLFVFDEPTSGLDPLMQTEFFELIKEYVTEGASCFLSTHVLSEVKKYCQKVAIMKEGRLLFEDRVENMTKSATKHIRLVRNGVEEEFTFDGDLQQLFAGLVEQKVDDILIEEPSLDEIFMQYYKIVSNDL